MVGLMLGLLSSVAYGVADFAGGVAARRAHVMQVVALAAPASLAVELSAWPILGAQWTPAAIGWGAGSGLASAAAFVLLYRCLARGPMSVLSPITAVISAALPVAAGLLLGERIGARAAVGIITAGVAIILVSFSRPENGIRIRPGSLLLAIGAATAIAAQLICLNQSPHGDGVAPLVSGRLVASVIVLSGVTVFRRRTATRSAPASARLIALLAGLMDSLANLAFLFAVHHARLAVIAVIVALYPAPTVLMARVVLTERIRAPQTCGLLIAAAAVILLAS
jgi:drug/metabolite transporter (DMT)-like permease